MWLRVALTHTATAFTQMFHLKVSPERKHFISAAVSRSKVWVIVVLHLFFFPAASISFPVFLIHTVAAVPQDLLINYTWTLLFNMGWKHTWAPGIKHTVLYILPVLYSNKWSSSVCVHVCAYMCVTFRGKKKKRNYSLALNFALSASLLNLVFNNSGANAELQISSQKNQINWLSSQAPCQSLGWRVNASPRTTKRHCAVKHKAGGKNNNKNNKRVEQSIA